MIDSGRNIALENEMYQVKNISHGIGATTFDLYKNINGVFVYQSTDTIYCIKKTEKAILKALGY